MFVLLNIACTSVKLPARRGSVAIKLNVWLVPAPALGITEMVGVLAIESIKVDTPVPFELVALKFTLEIPPTEGVPDIRPVAVLMESPAGKLVAP